MKRYTPQQRINLAMSAMRGNLESFRRLGVEPKTGAMGELNAIMRDAFLSMSPEEQAQDERETIAELDRLVSN